MQSPREHCHHSRDETGREKCEEGVEGGGVKVGGRDAGTEMRKRIRAAVGERSSADAWGGEEGRRAGGQAEGGCVER